MILLTKLCVNNFLVDPSEDLSVIEKILKNKKKKNKKNIEILKTYI